jgi:hypothetical protein
MKFLVTPLSGLYRRIFIVERAVEPIEMPESMLLQHGRQRNKVGGSLSLWERRREAPGEGRRI